MRHPQLAGNGDEDPDHSYGEGFEHGKPINTPLSPSQSPGRSPSGSSRREGQTRIMTTSLLRSSPAAGTGSYGAVPTLASTGLRHSPLRIEDDGEDEDIEGYISSTDSLDSHPTAVPIHKARIGPDIGIDLDENASKKRSSRRSSVKTVAEGSVPSLHGDYQTALDDEEEEEEDPNDPVDNSPCVSHLGSWFHITEYFFYRYAEVRASVSATDDTSLSINSNTSSVQLDPSDIPVSHTVV